MDGKEGLVSVALGTVRLTDFQRRAVRLKLTTLRMGDRPRWPKPATRDECRGFLQERGWRGMDAAESDLKYLKARLESQNSWRRGQPDLRGRAC